ncbi:MAG: monovalent cation/H(+) antiporter subunit G [Thermodesulfovibrio sp.]|jgi:multicomponent Na+:H+ antiporter subunit G|uniref:monovalent cation/H(+) antiporter subunit G n=1 Tax=unclassified Thermodesulfovibrio TaxID=2645936 RepID=UPI00083AD8CC|nr:MULTISPECIES: monovalent cation/H(+) antiporter subunit G [unclassified Thermodesulfovibrio]MDI1472249.1 monovalent cation/H(+) antiporter subunit G [Thermodesulfovibrio sp. 1176]MDI6714111.1 monovalent cation/H(+) antiporter subunit G [Thermodesulfovibrio sp.]ODA44629.1 sodium- potassium/hydrogen antiporter subunit G [Thermodesulfovibrio sp. N1]
MIVEYIIDAFVIILVLLGLFFLFTATVGLLRFPDFYCKLQATGKGDTLGAILILLGVILYNLHDFSLNNFLVCLKILFIIIFIFHANPVATHAITKAGLDADVKPLTKEDIRK